MASEEPTPATEAPAMTPPPAPNALEQAEALARKLAETEKRMTTTPVPGGLPPMLSQAPMATTPTGSPSSYCDDGLSDGDEDFAMPASKQGTGATFRDYGAAQGGQPQAGRANELTRAKQIAQKLGLTNLTDDEYDIPTFIRRQQEHDV